MTRRPTHPLAHITWLEQWFFERVLADSPSPVLRYPMHARLATDAPCPLPWSAVLGAGMRHEDPSILVGAEHVRAALVPGDLMVVNGIKTRTRMVELHKTRASVLSALERAS